MTQPLTAPDGRTLEVHELGDPDGFPVLCHSGTPGSGPLYARWGTPGVRLVGYDRAGYGGSTRRPGRAVADVVGDIETIAGALGFERYATWGISGGGPHTLACAALCDERLVAVASLAAVAPYGMPDLDWTAGMGESNVEEFDAVLAGETALRPLLERDTAEMLAATPDQLAAVWETLLGPEDRAVLSQELAAYI